MTVSQAFGLSTPVQYLKGVGPKRAEKFRDLGILTVGDLLGFFPRRYRFFEPVGSIRELHPDQEASVIGQITAVEYRRFPRPSRIRVQLTDKTDSCQACWFNCDYLRDRFHEGDWLRVQGKLREWRSDLQFANPKFEVFQDYPDTAAQNLSQPIYPAQDHFGSRFLAELIRRAFEACRLQIEDWFDTATLAERDLVDRRHACQFIHDPQSDEQWHTARRRLAYDELFFMQLAVMLTRRSKLALPASPLHWSDEIDERIRRRFPFNLTGAQNRAVDDIITDLASSRPMCRLIQGDVGCGKTAVAVYAALVAVANHQQVAIMAPTEILAQQHYRKIADYLADSKVRVELLIGGQPKAHRDGILQHTAAGQVDILIGTQALIQQDVRFANLALVVIDEQHKFGVHQRATIKSKGTSPHYLVMTATPIPRSLALTVFGDLDLTTIDESPPGRLPVKTDLFRAKQETKVWDIVAQRVRAGDQAYVVYPLLDESDKLELKSARTQAEHLAQGELAEFRVELIHGKMKPAEKQEVMARFRKRLIDVLVATVVIEVGVDVPDANVLVVEHAERFGLAQLHQLRGRIGRAGGQGHCLLLANATTEQAKQRLAVLLKTTDGFKIAEEDLRIRGPGQFFGTAQHGLPELKLADLVDDFPLLIQARKDALQLLKKDPSLSWQKNRMIRDELFRRFGDRIKLIEAA